MKNLAYKLMGKWRMYSSGIKNPLILMYHGVSDKEPSALQKNTAKHVNSDLFILPSITEGFPIAILEAMRVGLPIVSTNVAGIPEMINDGDTGLIIEPSVDGVFGFLSNFEKYDWKKMGENSHDLFLEKFTTHCGNLWSAQNSDTVRILFLYQSAELQAFLPCPKVAGAAK